MTNLKDIVQKIEAQTELTKEEIHKLINQKMEEYGSFITELGAAHIVARDLNITITSDSAEDTALPPKTTIKQLVPDLNNISIVGRIVKIYGVITFQRKDGSGEGILQSLIVKDKSDEIRVVCWDQKVGELQESNAKIGDPIRIIGGYTKMGREGSCELHIGNRGYIQIRPSDVGAEDIPALKLPYKKINNIRGTEKDISIQGKITKIENDILEFQRKNGTKGQKLSCVIGDETGEVLINFWNEKVNELEQLSKDNIVYVIGLTAKTQPNGRIELHTSRMTNVIKIEKESDIKVKKEFIEAEESIYHKSLKIKEIEDTNQLVSTEGIISSITPLHEFTRNDGSKGKVRNLFVTDSSDTIRVVLWDDKTDSISDKDTNKMIKINGGYTRKGRNDEVEIHCGNQAKIDVLAKTENIFDLVDVEFIAIEDINEKMKKVNVAGTITKLNPIKEITTKDDEIVELKTFYIADRTGSIRASSWRHNIGKLEDIKEKDMVKIINALVKTNQDYPTELIITGPTIVVKDNSLKENNFGFVSGTTMAEIEQSKKAIKDIEDIKEGDEVIVQGTVLNLHDRPFIYKLCPECNKGINEEDGKYICSKHGEIEEPSNLLLFTFTINDGTGSINVLCASNLAEQVLDMDTKQVNDLVKEQASERAPYLLLKNKNFEDSLVKIKGLVRKNTFLDCLEIRASNIETLEYVRVTRELLKNYQEEV